jgi:hypothetical protein
MDFSVCDIFLYILEYKNEDGKFSSLTRKMRQIDIFWKVIRHMLNSTAFPKPYRHRNYTHTQEFQRSGGAADDLR